MNYKSFSDLSNDIRKNIFKVQSKQYDLVVGLPRSGMVPAYMIALYLNIDCTDLGSFIENRPLKKGMTRGIKNILEFPQDAKNILLVDDSIWSGVSLLRDIKLIPEQLREKITTLAVYSTKPKRDDVDFFLEYLPVPRVFEWNIFHHDMLTRACLDIDGVLCLDPTEEENDDGDKYIDFILNATPLFLPTTRIHSLVTSRLEKYRSETEKWLSKHNIIYDNLIMLDLPSKEERLRLKAHGTHKAKYYKNSKIEFFIESDASQALEICKLAGKAVFCIDNNSMYNPNLTSKILKNPKSLKKYIPYSIKKSLMNAQLLLNKLKK